VRLSIQTHNTPDLAGSERLKKSEVMGEALKEAQSINKSLAALGNVIAALKQRYVALNTCFTFRGY
jgi:hypothetical protein